MRVIFEEKCLCKWYTVIVSSTLGICYRQIELDHTPSSFLTDFDVILAVNNKGVAVFSPPIYSIRNKTHFWLPMLHRLSSILYRAFRCNNKISILEEFELEIDSI